MATVSIDDFLKDDFDFVIVGGGTAGLVVAARLSEDQSLRIGVIEAGLSRLGDPKVDLPGGPGLMMNNPDYDWNFRSAPQEAANGSVYHMPRGKMLGGCSGINFMSYGRPCAQDIDDWAETLGLEGWSWADLLPYFMKSEGLEVDLPNVRDRNEENCPIDTSTHGLHGPIHTSMGVWQVPFEEALIVACDEVSGINRPKDPYCGSHVGFYRSIFTIDRTKKPIRSYAASGYLAPILTRPNLRILTEAHACKVIFQTQKSGQPVVQGVSLLHLGTIYSIRARREIILSAGSLQSPQILELSGIGDRQVLKQAKIECLVDNPNVGNNLQEHVMSAVVYELAPGQMSIDSVLADATLLKQHQSMYAELHSGALSGSVSLTGYVPYGDCVASEELLRTVGGISVPIEAPRNAPAQNAIFQAKQQKAIANRMRKSEAADVQFIGSPANFDISRGYSDCSKLMTGAPADHNACYSIAVSNMYPISRGNVHVKSSNPMDIPLIDPGFLSCPTDVEVLAAGVTLADHIFQSTRLEGKVRRRVSPPATVNLEARDEAKAFVREHIVSYHHALGTCAMGQVVDQRLRVKGVKGLRVVDASILPMQLSAAIMATVYAAAEKAADMIKEDWSQAKTGMYSKDDC